MKIEVTNFDVSVNNVPVSNPALRILLLLTVSWVAALVVYTVAVILFFISGTLIGGIPYAAKLVVTELHPSDFMVWVPLALFASVALKKCVSHLKKRMSR
ncbi:hypothetical protein DSLASN_30500 [Desulfoluna limicola]|uniref:Uncharacterized protein n=1 Tax=Desulfoluna limicola TaxID=2810562 RepID=A0ABM7PJY3_9BACT|nr:hypothetical protein [Desulfoluna limicola]BCS97418.1 hypothetical protein DSLASN_30500 [Desulfoluna limicola]